VQVAIRDFRHMARAPHRVQVLAMLRIHLVLAALAGGVSACASSPLSSLSPAPKDQQTVRTTLAGRDAPDAPPTRDGQHDFDFNFGAWRTHIKRVVHPLAHSSETFEMTGTVTNHTIWGGRAQLEEIEVDGPKGHWEGMSLFLYNPASHQWSQSFINSASGTFAGGLIGSFANGRGELYSEDTDPDGHAILVRGEWSEITPTSHRYEESYSYDGGKTWAPALTASLTKDRAPAAEQPAALTDGARDFEFDLGNWKTHSSRLLHPLTGSHDWVELDGTTVVTKIWGGRANLAEYKADGASGHLELLSLRIYSPTTHQWSLNFATPTVGTLGVPGIGQFKNGRGDFYDQEVISGRAVLVRFSIWSITPMTAQSEQAFSTDGGKTWESNWINRYTRVAP
jgi:hypothetical protein